MPTFLRRWVALESHEAALRQELSFIHQTYTRKSPHVMESLMYREHFLGAEFIGLVVYAEAGLETRSPRRTRGSARRRSVSSGSPSSSRARR